MASNSSSTSAGVCTVASMGCEFFRPSKLNARMVSLATNCVHIFHSGWMWSTALSPIHEAKLSLSHRSSHHCIVTRSPNHMCAISCDTTSATRCRVAAGLMAGSTSSAVSRYVMAPQFSMAPAAKSGIAMWSSFSSGYGMPK